MSNTRFDRLVAKLRELFQLDQPELDFGIYRILHARSEDITAFLENDLLPQVKDALAAYQPADKAALQAELDEAIAQATSLGADPDTLPKVQDLRERLENEAVDLGALEADVYDHLYRFFARYYNEGDFISLRRYKEGVYAIPYEGEEVKLHWANHDQYYIKTAEYLRDYAFRLRPDDAADPMRVHFRLLDAAEGEHGNVKEAEGKKRVFVLAAGDFIAEEPGESGAPELVLQFEYRPATVADWPEAVRAGKDKPPSQDQLRDLAVERVLAIDDPALTRWLLALREPQAKSAEASRLWHHVKRYVARNTFDYFIHKDLGGFLRRELDFYIKSEVMRLDDIDDETAPRVEQYLSKIKVIRRIALKIVDFLAQLEDFQKKLWLKKKFVTETSWCVSIATILAIEDEGVRKDMLAEIAANGSQRAEWVELHGIDALQPDLERPAYAEPLTPDFAAAYPTLMIDTRHFEAAFVEQLLGALGDLDELTDGVLFHSENFQALSLMQARYREQVKCIYIDPPYNAKSSEILYKNDYKHASWLSLMDGRVASSRTLLPVNGVFVAAIDEVEQERLGQLLTMVFPGLAKDCIVVNHNPSGQQGDNFSFTHEYAYFLHREPGRYIAEQERTDPSDWDERNLRDVTGADSLRTAGKTCFYPILVRESDLEVVGFGPVCPDDFHPPVNVPQGDGIVAVYPIDPGGVERKWRFARDTVERIAGELRGHRVSGRNVIDIKRTKKTFNYKSNWTDAKYSANNHGTQLLNHILPAAPVSYPKSLWLVRDCVHAASNGDLHGICLDYFAGSGTTGHAVIGLNREDGGSRKFVLVEMGEYFDTVLLPRLKKVAFAPEWKDGRPKRLATPEEAERSPRVFKVVRLESYEDALNNLELKRSESQQTLLDTLAASGAGGLKEQYLLGYMLDVESRGSTSLLNVRQFIDPRVYTLRVKRPGSDETREVTVDLPETFNWLLGLRVHHIVARQSFSATFRRDDEGRLKLDGRLKIAADGGWWFRTVQGDAPDGRKVLVIWRTRPGGDDAEGIEQDNLVLDEWFTRQGYSAKDNEFDLIYVNGDNNLENLKDVDDRWKVRLIEEEFFRLMFDVEDV